MSRKKRKHDPAAEVPQQPTAPAPTPPQRPTAAPARTFSKPVLILTGLLALQSACFSYLILRQPRESSGESPEAAQGELDRILALPDAEFQRVSLARINLLVAKEIEPNLDVETYMSKFDGLVEELRQANLKHHADRTDPDKLIRVLNTFLYFDKKFRYAKLGESTDPAVLSQDPKNLFLYGILERMQGTCISMPVLYIALGEAMGYPIKGVNAGDHFFCRWDGGGYISNIEPTGGGGWSPDEDYIRDMKVTEKQQKSGAYMRSLTKRELVGNFFFARACYQSLHGQNSKSTQDFMRAVAWNSRDVDGYANLAELFARQAHYFGKEIDLPATYSKLTINDIKRQGMEGFPGSGTMSGPLRYPMPGNSLLPPAPGVPGTGGFNPRPGNYLDPSILPQVPDPMKDLPVPGLNRR